MAVEAVTWSPTTSELVQLAKHLKQERLFVLSEKTLLSQIHEEVTQTADKLFRLSWITRQQRQTLNSLCLASADAPPNVCCSRANALENVEFIDSYKSLGVCDSLYGELLAYLRDNPKIIGQCLTIGEKERIESTRVTVHTVMSSVFANCVVQVDERNALFLLQSLMENQLSNSDDPRRLLRMGRCAFSQAFKLLTESLFASRLYLTAALYEPIMGVLMDDEKCLETNPQKALAQFSPEEIIQRFGTLGSEEYHQKLAAHLESVNDQLVALCNRFMMSLKNNTYCFPQSLDWIISQLHKILSKSEHIDQLELRAMCADLLMVHFICPAIVSPEPYGITSDVLISETARFNLMQVGQILQGLALQTGTAEEQAKANNIYSKFPKGCMSSFLDVLIDNLSTSDTPPTSIQLQGMTRSSALITNTEIENLVGYFRAVIAACPENAEFKDLEALLSSLPMPSLSAGSEPFSPPGGSPPKHHGLTPPSTPPVGLSRKTGNLAQKVSNKVSKTMGRQLSHSALKEEEDGQEAILSPDPITLATQPEDVLVVSFGNTANDCPGMLPEYKILSLVPERSRANDDTDSEKSNKSSNLMSISEMPEKQLRFSTEASGNGDHLIDAISTGGSVYSMDLETENASILSGRQTPRSAVSMGSSTTEQVRPDLIDSAQLSNSTNITDRFGKFEIGTELDNKRAAGNPETFSETWSTDVIGSDSEPPSEANPNERLQEIAEVQREEGVLGGAAAAALLDVRPNIMDISETASETWSVDVLQSDSEQPDDRLQEVDEAHQEEVIQTLALEAEGDHLSSKASEGHSSRRSSCESHSMGRSSNNGSPGVDDGTKKEAGSDEGSNSQFFDSTDNPSLLKSSSTEDSASSSVGGDIPQPIMLPASIQPRDPFLGKSPLAQDRTSKGDRNGKQFSSQLTGRASSGAGNMFDPFSCAPAAYTAAVVSSSSSLAMSSKSRNSYTQSRIDTLDSLLSDFDPFASTPTSSIYTPPFPVHDHMLNNNKPLGAKPKTRAPVNKSAHQFQSVGAGHDMFHTNLGFDNNFTAPPPVQRANPFDLVDSDHSHRNHGFFDADMQPDLINSFSPPNPTSASSPFSPTLINSTTKSNGSAFHGLGGDSLSRSDSGVVSGSSSSQEHLSQRTDSSGSSGNASFLTSSHDSAKMPDMTAQNKEQNWSSLERPNHLGNQQATSTLSLGALVTSSETDKMPNGGFRSQITDSTVSLSAETLALYGDKLLDGEQSDRKLSWFNKKKGLFKAFNNRISTRTKSTKDRHPMDSGPVPRPDRGEGYPLRDSATKETERKISDSIQIISNLALVAEPFEEEDAMKSASVPTASSEDILNKYRELRRVQSTENLDGSDGATPNDGDQPLESSTDESVSKPESSGSDTPYLDPENLENSYAFTDAKRKLRIVLRSADFQTLPWLCNYSQPELQAHGVRGVHDRREEYPENELVAFLKVQLAEAMNLQDKSLIAQLRETLRCVQNFDNKGCKKLLVSLREDYERRTPYIAYLVRSRKGLISSRAHLERLLERVQRDKETVNKYFTMVCVRLFLERQEPSIQKFINDFKALTAADDKTYLVMYFIGKLNQWIQNDPIWQAASETQKSDAQVATERAIMSRIYKLALYPNAEGDIARDQVLHEHIKRLSKVVTASHRALQIPEKYRRESPWPAAQAEILGINVYKTPKDKLQCIYRCCMIIMNLLSMTNESSVPGADDFAPVLMFVLIKANPPCLLSTVQYVNSFYYENEHYSTNDNPMAGEEQYWWMQFCAAIEYIKTIDDRK